MFRIDHSGSEENWMLNVINACEGKDVDDAMRRLGTALIFMVCQTTGNDMEKAAEIIHKIAEFTGSRCAPPPSIWEEGSPLRRGATH